MDIELARTYLAVVTTGSFFSAAEKLKITPTAVSARIRHLEDQLGRQLFVRNKSGARLTIAGERFLRPASTLVQVWESARQQICLPPGRKEVLSVGAEQSLWDPLLVDWLLWMRREQSDIALRVEVDSTARLMDRLSEGLLDVAVLHNPPRRDDLVAELLCEEKLVLVTTAPQGGEQNDEDYVYVDWGPAFSANHQVSSAHLAHPPVSIDFGPLARSYLLAVGGAGYFRLRSVERYIQEGSLWRVAGAPEFSHSIYIVYAGRRGQSLIDLVRVGMRDCVAKR